MKIKIKKERPLFFPLDYGVNVIQTERWLEVGYTTQRNLDMKAALLFQSWYK